MGDRSRIPITASNTQVTATIPRDARHWSLTNEAGTPIRWSMEAGQVASSTGRWHELGGGGTVSFPNVRFTAATPVYLYSEAVDGIYVTLDWR